VAAGMNGSRRGTCGHIPVRYQREGLEMLGFIAAILFVIAFILYAASVATVHIFSPTSLMLAGLACLALHLSGVGTNWSVRR
jgi:hypothetical protein